MKLINAMDLKFPKIISLVGGGGKTSFIFTLAKEAADLGKSVLITTTTAMFNPELFEPTPICPPQAFNRLFIGPARDLPIPLPGTVLVAGSDLKAQGSKLAGYSLQPLTTLLRSSCFDLVLIEADGARMLPVKAPAAHEPVIPNQSDMVVGCIGLDCLGSPLDSAHVHRPEILGKLSGQQTGEAVTVQTLLRLTASEKGLFKSIRPEMKKTLVLNKADTPHLAEQGMSLGRDIISRHQADLCLVTCFQNQNNPVIRKITSPHF